ncbi:MAG: hypothetical protein U9O87_11205, partial [Verrucomicrobiota bacterium]|nr:hypothetical protein [Verrucomicrobiota bacterium]
VRLYEGQSTGGASKGKVGKKTVSEAQLVGRGARYCPFRQDGKAHKNYFAGIFSWRICGNKSNNSFVS